MKKPALCSVHFDVTVNCFETVQSEVSYNSSWLVECNVYRAN